MAEFHYGNAEAQLNLAGVLGNAALTWPDNIAAIASNSGVGPSAGRTLTYRELDVAANRFANGLAALGVTVGDRVAVMLPNVVEFPIVYFAILKLGATVVPVNTLFREIEIRYILEDSRAKAIVAWRPIASEVRKAMIGSPSCRHCILAGYGDSTEALSPGEGPRSTTGLSIETMSDLASAEIAAFPTRETDTAVILYTSGTTGRSKGAELTHFNLQRNAATVARLIDITERDRFVATLPLFHSFGQTHVMNATFLRGGAIMLHARFDAASVLDSFARGGATLFAGVPTMYVYLLNATQSAAETVETRDLASPRPEANSLRLCISGGAPMPVPVLEEFQKRFGATILEGYGLSETSPVACSNRPDRVCKPGSIGLPLPEAEVLVVDDDDRELPPGEVGELLIRGPMVMKGYLNKPEATAEAMRGGWFHSGDLARLDEDGYVYIVDRKKDMILKSGYNVYPREVEDVLYRHPAVGEAAVVGVPDAAKGEDVKAYVVLREGCAASEEEIVGHCRELIAPYKCPRYVEFVPALPKSATGKILRRELRDQVASPRGRSAPR